MKFIHLFIIILLLFHFTDLANANTTNIEISIGTTKIKVQSPNGFHEISSLSPKTIKNAEKMTPPGNRLLAVFVSEEDLGRIMKNEEPLLKRYMFLQTLRKTENISIARAQFEQIASQIKEHQNSLLGRYRTTVDTLLENAPKITSNGSEKIKNIKIGEQVPLGVFYERNSGIGFATLTKYQIQERGENLDYVVAGSVFLLHARDKFLYAYIYSTYESNADVNWVRTKSEEWIDSIYSLEELQDPR